MADPVSLVARMIAREHSVGSTSSNATAPRTGTPSPAHVHLPWQKPSMSPSSSVSHPTNAPLPAHPLSSTPGTAAGLHELDLVESLLAGLPAQHEPGAGVGLGAQELPLAYPRLASSTHLHRALEAEAQGLQRYASGPARAPLAHELLYGLAMQEKEREGQSHSQGVPAVHQVPALSAGAGAGGSSAIERLLAQSDAGDLELRRMQVQRLQMALGRAGPRMPPAGSLPAGLSPELIDLLLHQSGGRRTPDPLTTLGGDGTPAVYPEGGRAASQTWNPGGPGAAGMAMGATAGGQSLRAMREGSPLVPPVAPVDLQEQLLREQLLLQLRGAQAQSQSQSQSQAFNAEASSGAGAHGRAPALASARLTQSAHTVSLSPARRGGSSSSGGGPMEVAMDGGVEGGTEAGGEEHLGSLDDAARAKKLRRLAGNREAARRLRKRQTERLADLEEQVRKLRRAHSDTLNQLQRARARIHVLTKENQRLEQTASDLRTALACCDQHSSGPRQTQQRTQQPVLSSEGHTGGPPPGAAQEGGEGASAALLSPAAPALADLWQMCPLDDELWALPSDGTC